MCDIKNIAQLHVRYKKYRTLILINTFHSIIKFLWWNFDENCWKVSVFIVRDNISAKRLIINCK